jgi:hypothetical protein
LVLIWYPADFTFVCPTEIIAFSDRLDEFKKLNAEVVVASTDSAFVHQAWANVLFRFFLIIMPLRLQEIKEELKELKCQCLLIELKKLQDHLEFLLVEELRLELHLLLMVMALLDMCFIIILFNFIFIINRSVNDTGVGRSVDEILRLISAFQFVFLIY